VWWPRKRKPAATPLRPGRDRSRTSERPVYSYYASRPKSERSADSSFGGTRAVRIPRNDTANLVKAAHSGNTLLYVGCAVVVLVCMIKILFLVPESKIVFTGQYTKLDTQAATQYAREANRLLASSVLNRSKITLNTNGIAKKLQRTFPGVETVVVAVPIVGNHPVVYISPAKAAFQLKTPNGMYAVDQHGYVLSALTSPAADLITLQEQSARPATPGKQYLAGSTVGFAAAAVHQLGKAGYTVRYLDLPVTAPYELDVYVEGKAYYVRFNLQGDVLQQSGGLIAALKQQATGIQPSVYVDVRTPGRVFVR